MTKALILAAGKGSRMKSKTPKVLIQLDRKILVRHVFDALQISHIDQIGIVYNESVEKQIKKEFGDQAKYILQSQPLGTGHAVICAKDWLEDFNEDLIVVVGDAPFITKSIISNLLQTHRTQRNTCTLLSAFWEDPPPYGRIVRDVNGEFIRIVEEKDASEEDKQIKELSSSHYCFHYPDLIDALQKINNNNVQQEFYLPDVIEIFIKEGKKVEAIPVDDPMITFGINTKEELESLQRKKW